MRISDWSSDVCSSDLIITGKVTSADTGEPVPGVTVTVNGTTVATQTDLEGNYELEPTQGQVLTFTFLGLKPGERTVGSAGTINLRMTADAEALAHVVVVGYGAQQRENLPNEVSTLHFPENQERRPIRPEIGGP